MKFDDATVMMKEISAAEKLRDRHYVKTKDMVESTVGPYWGPETDKVDGEKFGYEFSTWMIGQMVGEKPVTKVVSRRRSKEATEVAEAMESGGNRWIHDTRFKKELMELANDSLYSWGVTVTTLEDNDSLRGVEIPTEVWSVEGSPLRPAVQRLKQEMFAADPAATSWETARYKFHRWVRDKESLIKDAEKNPEDGWDLEAIEAMVENTDAKDLGRLGKGVPDRNEVMAYEIWVPEFEMERSDVPWEMEKGEEPTAEHGYHGAILTMGHPYTGDTASDKEAGGWIRKPIPYYGPPSGPYTLYGIYPVSGELYPLGPIVAVQSLIEELNRADRAMSVAAESGKQLLLYDSKNTAMAERIKNAETSTYLGIDGFNPADVLANVQVGGLEATAIAWRNDRRALLDRVSGFSEQQRGKVAGGGTTATDSTIADSNADIRTDLVKSQFMDCVAVNLEKVAWYLYHEEEIVFLVDMKEEAVPVGEIPGNEATPREGWFKGGIHDDESGLSFYDLELEIDPYSMKRTNEGMEQRRFFEMFKLLLEWANLIGASPMLAMAINWEDIFDMAGDTMNMPAFGGLIDMDMLKQAAGVMLQMQQAEGEAKLSGDAKGASAGQFGGGVAMPGQQMQVTG